MKKEVTTTLEIITPEVASEYLSHNTLNRRPTDENVRSYAREMKEGRWRANPSEPISFADDGTLINGQHRLHAVIKAGCAVTMAVLRGADKKDFEVIDTGKKRTGGDLLSIAGVANYNRIAAIIKAYFSISKGSASNIMQGTQKMGLTNKAILDEYVSTPDTFQTIGRMAGSSYRSGHYMTEAEFGGIMAFLIKGRHHDIEIVKAFFEELANGGNFKVIALLRNKLSISANTKGTRDKLDKQGKRCLIAKAWNIFLSGRDVHTLSYREGDKYHFD